MWLRWLLRYDCLAMTLFLMIIAIPAQAKSAHSLAKEGSKLYQENKYAAAAKKFLEAQIESPEDLQMSYNLGNACYKAGDYANAARNFLQSAASKDTRLAEKSYYNLGNTHFRMKRLDEAITYYKKALGMDTKDEDAKKNLAFVQKQLEKKQQQSEKEEKDQKESQEGKNSSGPKDGQPSQENQDKNQQTSQGKEEQKKETKEGKVETAQKQDQEKKSAGQDQKPDQAAQKQAAKKISDEQAQHWLSTLNEDRQKYMQMQLMKNKQQSQGRQVEKDW
ncbi:MAG: tetratricopeptide repeat protein [Candidatus Schekmanbacteria bacterium]|nr:tetratricopeptide repeat protein [Candidatus Schekmanbacteria bacterium]